MIQPRRDLETVHYSADAFHGDDFSKGPADYLTMFVPILEFLGPADLQGASKCLDVTSCAKYEHSFVAEMFPQPSPATNHCDVQETSRIVLLRHRPSAI
jgi:hypothetical protein